MSVEPDTRTFLRQIANTLSSVLVFLILHLLIGIYLGWGLFESKPTLANWIYYVVFVATGFLLFLVIKRIWNKP